ncbi:hypothetical protein STEG23_032450, partial [Scotinomys teguina]
MVQGLLKCVRLYDTASSKYHYVPSHSMTALNFGFLNGATPSPQKGKSTFQPEVLILVRKEL